MFLEAYIPPQIELAVEVDAPYIFDRKIARCDRRSSG